MDGYMARKYDMVTDYGDMLDHVGDWTLLVLFLILVFKYKLLKNGKKYRIYYFCWYMYNNDIYSRGCQKE